MHSLSNSTNTKLEGYVPLLADNIQIYFHRDLTGIEIQDCFREVMRRSGLMPILELVRSREHKNQ